MIIELFLTIAAWRRGWGAIALLPVAVGFTLGILGSAMSNSLIPAVMGDFLIYAALIPMIIAGRKKPSETATAGVPAISVETRTAA
ncbi:MAG TPA: hypothetical protein VF392_16555 [Terracidiphilus sp.]